MKNLFIAALVMTGMSVFANNEEKPPVQKVESDSFPMCCQYTLVHPTGETFTAKSCVEGGTDWTTSIAAWARACGNAKKAAELAIYLL